MDLELSNEYFRKRNGLDRSEGIIFILKKKSIPDISDNIKNSICPDIKPQTEKLQQLFMKEKEALDIIVEFQGGYFFDSDRKALLNKIFRIKLSELIKQVGQCYVDAAYLIENI